CPQKRAPSASGALHCAQRNVVDDAIPYARKLRETRANSKGCHIHADWNARRAFDRFGRESRRTDWPELSTRIGVRVLIQCAPTKTPTKAPTKEVGNLPKGTRGRAGRGESLSGGGQGAEARRARRARRIGGECRQIARIRSAISCSRGGPFV